MKAIKTISIRLDNANTFDERVNKALSEGWELKKREVIRPLAQSETTTFFIMLYAELEKQ